MTDSRQKGKEGERELGHEFDRLGLQYIREQDGRQQGSDFLVERLYVVECRRRENLSLSAWHKAHEAKTPAIFVPVIAYRRSREPWRCSMKLDDWAAMALALVAA